MQQITVSHKLQNLTMPLVGKCVQCFVQRHPLSFDMLVAQDYRRTMYLGDEEYECGADCELYIFSHSIDRFTILHFNRNTGFFADLTNARGFDVFTRFYGTTW